MVAAVWPNHLDDAKAVRSESVEEGADVSIDVFLWGQQQHLDHASVRNESLFLLEMKIERAE